ncbi:MAG: hypothetical protein NTW28_18235, partial [Candidatus Solibacter sp.]|nr:hypothetical protein [Candidatus Solibacter sp.]
MTLTVRTMVAALGLACAAAAQGLPPGALLLARVKQHVREQLARLPNCSCLETVRRDYQPVGGKMRPLDTIRLEVLYSDRRELYASPGDRNFTEDHPIAFVGGGTIGDGYFALFLSDVVSEHRASYEYKGEELVLGPFGGRPLARFDYRVPVSVSGHTMSFSEGRGTVGMKGSFWADPASYDILRITVEAEEIPLTLPVLSSVTSIDYAHTNLGGTDFLLPQSAATRLVKLSGEESRNYIEFTHCHLYGAQSSISFGPRVGLPQFGASSVLEMKRELLPALQVVIKLSTRITDQTAVGALVEGVVAGKVLRKGSVLIPDGSPVRGRVRRLEWYDYNGGYYVVGFEFTDIEAAGKRYRFFADLEDMDRLPGVSETIRTSKQESRA